MSFADAYEQKMGRELRKSSTPSASTNNTNNTLPGEENTNLCEEIKREIEQVSLGVSITLKQLYSSCSNLTKAAEHLATSSTLGGKGTKTDSQLKVSKMFERENQVLIDQIKHLDELTDDLVKLRKQITKEEGGEEKIEQKEKGKDMGSERKRSVSEQEFDDLAIPILEARDLFMKQFAFTIANLANDAELPVTRELIDLNTSAGNSSNDRQSNNIGDARLGSLDEEVQDEEKGKREKEEKTKDALHETDRAVILSKLKPSPLMSRPRSKAGKDQDAEEVGGGKEQGPVQVQLQREYDNYDYYQDEENQLEGLTSLQRECVELNEIFKTFHQHIQSQSAQLRAVEDQMEEIHSVQVDHGLLHLSRAARYQMASYPILGAIAGGILAGPLGMIAGIYKGAGVVMMGAAMVGGAGVGAGAGVEWQKRKGREIDEIEPKLLPKEAVESVEGRTSSGEEKQSLLGTSSTPPSHSSPTEQRQSTEQQHRWGKSSLKS